MSEDNKEFEQEESTVDVNTDQNNNDQPEEESSDSEFDRAVEATKVAAAKKKTAKKKASKKTAKKTAKAKSTVEDLDLSEDQEAVLAAIQRGQTLRAAAIAVLKRASNYKEEVLREQLPSATKKVKQGQLIEAIKELV